MRNRVRNHQIDPVAGKSRKKKKNVGIGAHVWRKERENIESLNATLGRTTGRRSDVPGLQRRRSKEKKTEQNLIGLDPYVGLVEPSRAIPKSRRWEKGHRDRDGRSKSAKKGKRRSTIILLRRETKTGGKKTSLVKSAYAKKRRNHQREKTKPEKARPPLTAI